MGTLISIVTGICTTWGMYRILNVSDSLEQYAVLEPRDPNTGDDENLVQDFRMEVAREDRDKEFIIKRFQDFPEILGYHNYRSYEMITIFINSMVNLVFNLTNLTYVFKLLVVMFPVPLNIIRLFTFVIYSAVIYFVIEPEKLRWMTTITMTTFMTISKLFFSR